MLLDIVLEVWSHVDAWLKEARSKHPTWLRILSFLFVGCAVLALYLVAGRTA